MADRMTNDVFHNFIPKMGEYYYSKMSREIIFEKYDEKTDILEIKEISQMEINSHSAEIKVPYRFSISGTLDSNLDNPYKITHLNIDSNDFTKDVSEEIINQRNVLQYNLELTGKEKYYVVRKMVRRFRVGHDPVISMVATRFTEGMTVRVINKIPNLTVEAIGMGIPQGEISRSLTSDEQLDYTWTITRLLFPDDGVTLVIKKC